MPTTEVTSSNPLQLLFQAAIAIDASMEESGEVSAQINFEELGEKAEDIYEALKMTRGVIDQAIENMCAEITARTTYAETMKRMAGITEDDED